MIPTFYNTGGYCQLNLNYSDFIENSGSSKLRINTLQVYIWLKLLLIYLSWQYHSDLKLEADGSLKILVSSKSDASIPESNWLPAPEGKRFSLTLRTYVPKKSVKLGEWFPPVIDKMK